MKKLLAAVLGAALFFGGYTLGSRQIRTIGDSAREAAILRDAYAFSLLEVDLNSLRAVNPDVLGWIVIPDTSLSYPLLQGTDNGYYLNHSWQGNYDPAGAVFVEYRDAADFSSFNTRIYGHRMGRDSMFNCLQNYGSEEYLTDHPKVYIVTAEGVRVYRIFAACEVTVNAPVYWLTDSRTEYRQDVIDFCMVNSVVKTGIFPAVSGRMLTLSTCVGLLPSDQRWVVLAMETELITR